MKTIEANENDNALAVQPRNAVTTTDFMPLFTVSQAVERKNMVNQFISGVLKESEDFGTIPGAGKKKVLLKPGAEKLCSIFGLSVTYTEDKIIEDWTGENHGGEPIFYYSYRCQLSRGDKFMGEAIGSCNSWESKYRYRWVPEEAAKGRTDFDTLVKRGGRATKFEPNFALDKKETTGQYGKPVEHWETFEAAIKAGTARNVSRKMGKREFEGWEIEVDQTQYRIPNPEFADAINTCQKMAQKRALVAAVLVVTNCSDAFTQDVEDFESGHSEPIRDGFPSTPPPPQSQNSGNDSGAFPVELLAEYEAIQKNRNQFPVVCGKIADMIIAKGGKAGGGAYDKFADDMLKRFPRGIQNISDIRAVLIQLWALYQSTPEQTPFD